MTTRYFTFALGSSLSIIPKCKNNFWLFLLLLLIEQDVNVDIIISTFK